MARRVANAALAASLALVRSVEEWRTAHLAAAEHEQESRREATAREALVAVGLASLVPRLGGLHTPHSPQAWHASLSPGQRQQLICARVFVHSPALVMLDEATSAMPAADEARIYARLRERGMAFVSIGHRASLEEYHDEVMELS